MATFKTIREVAATGLLAEHHLRSLFRQGKLPGIMIGKKFLVNVEQLVEQLDQESRSAVRTDGTERQKGYTI